MGQSYQKGGIVERKNGDGQCLRAGGRELSISREMAEAMQVSHRLRCANHQVCLELQ